MKNTQRIIIVKKHIKFSYIFCPHSLFENIMLQYYIKKYDHHIWLYVQHINLKNETNKITSKIIRKLNFKTKTLTKIKNKNKN